MFFLTCKSKNELLYILFKQDMKQFIGAFIFAFIASVGNALFVYGSKKSADSSNPFLFTIFALSGCVFLMLPSFFFFPAPEENYRNWLLQNKQPILLTSFGLLVLYLGFYLLYSKYGASYYTLYAVLSIITTSIIVAVVFFGEKFNFYFILSIFFASLTILFFYLGQQD